ncbi:MAG: hypothetical protein LBR89_02110 [Holosporales bacterium]|nr:hypothetical protein [Holosporales bacterium]
MKNKIGYIGALLSLSAFSADQNLVDLVEDVSVSSMHATSPLDAAAQGDVDIFAEISKLQEQLESAKSAHASSEKKFLGQVNRNNELSVRIAKLQRRRDELYRENNEQSAELVSTRRTSDATIEELRQRNNEIYRELALAQSSIQTLQQEIADKDQIIREQQVEHDVLFTQIAQINEQKKSLNLRLSLTEALWNSGQTKLLNAEQKFCTLVSLISTALREGRTAKTTYEAIGQGQGESLAYKELLSTYDRVFADLQRGLSEEQRKMVD